MTLPARIHRHSLLRSRNTLQVAATTTTPYAHTPYIPRVLLSLSGPSDHIHTYGTQQRVIQTCANPATITFSRAFGTPSRSPHQWSHIIHSDRGSPSRTNAVAMGHTGLVNGQQKRGHMGHSHSHHHHHDNTYLTSKNKSDPGVRITRIGLYVNLGMAVAKGAGGVAFNSQACVYSKVTRHY